MQVDSIKTHVESAQLWLRFQSLKLEYGKLLSTVGFQFNLRRYVQDSWGFFNWPPVGPAGCRSPRGRHAF